MASTEEERVATGRRRVLRALGATGAAFVAAGCSRSGDGPDREPGPGRPTTASPTTDPARTTTPEELARFAGEYDAVVNVVDAGADPTARESVVPVLRQHVADDTLVYFPEGTYLMDGVLSVSSFSNVGFVGRDATIVPGDYPHYLFALGFGPSATGLRFQGITFDFTAAGAGARPLQVQVSDGLVVRDVAVVGRQEAGSGMMRFDVVSADGTGRVERLALPDGAVPETRTTGCLVSPANRGHLSVVDCRMAGFPDNGLYASPSTGPVTVRGGVYENNAISNVRVGGDAVVDGVTVRCTAAPRGFENMRGVRLHGGGPVRVTDCDVTLREVTSSGGGVVVTGGVSRATIRNVRVRADVDRVPALRLKPRPAGGDDDVQFESVEVAGEAGDQSAVVIAGRHDCSLSNVAITQTGPDRNGVHVVDSENVVIRDARIDVTGRPLVTEQSSVVRTDLTTPE